MQRSWWRFWAGSAWRTWLEERRNWASYRSALHDMSARISITASQLGHAKQTLGQTLQALQWVEPLGTTPVPLSLKRNEIGLAIVPQVTLLELRQRDGRRQWTPVATGEVSFTDRRAVFVGSKEVTFEFKDLTEVSLRAEGLHLAVKRRKTSHVLAGPATQLDTVLRASRSIAAGVDPLPDLHNAREAATRQVAALEGQLAELNQARQALDRPARPHSPAWAAGLAVTVVFGLATGGLAQQSLAPAPSTTAITSERDTSSPMAVSTTTTTTAPAPEVVTGTVASITDGDTFRVLLPDGSNEPLRLIGIDAPDAGDPLYAEAKAYLATLIEGAEVVLIRDVSDRDRFGRLLRYVYAGDLFVNLAMVQSGYAVAIEYPPDTAQAVVLADAEESARAAGAGLWAPTTTVATTTTATTTTTTAPPATTTSVPAQPECHPSYEGACLAIGQGDYDCEGGRGDGPNYVRGPIRVVGYDEFDLDRDGDGVGCES